MSRMIPPGGATALAATYRDRKRQSATVFALGCSLRKLACLLLAARQHLAEILDRLDLLGVISGWAVIRSRPLTTLRFCEIGPHFGQVLGSCGEEVYVLVVTEECVHIVGFRQDVPAPATQHRDLQERTQIL
jgi:hypothetical protein